MVAAKLLWKSVFNNSTGGRFFFWIGTKTRKTKRRARPYCNGFSFGAESKPEGLKDSKPDPPEGSGFTFGNLPKSETPRPAEVKGHGGFAFGSLPGTTKLADAKENNGPKAGIAKGIATGADVIAKETKVPEGLYQSGANDAVSSLQVDVSSASISYGNFDSFVATKNCKFGESKPKQEENLINHYLHLPLQKRRKEMLHPR